MKPNRNSLNLAFLIFLITVSLAFIVSSVWLIYAVNQKRHRIENLVNQVGIISDLEQKLTECLDLSERGDEIEFQKSIEQIVETDFSLAVYPDLDNIAAKTYDLKRYFEISGVLMKFQPFQDDLRALYLFSIEEKKEKRKGLGLISEELSEDWRYTHALIILACALAILSCFITLSIFKSRKNINKLKIRNSLFMNSIADCVIACDNKGKIIEVNEVAEATFGYTTKEFMNLSVFELYADENNWNAVQDKLGAGKFFRGEIVNKSKNGNQFTSFLSANVVYDDKGNRAGTLGISRDISGQKRDQEQFQYIVDNATDIIYTTNVQGEITYINASANSILGYSNEDTIGMSFRELIHPEFLKQVEDHYANQFKKRITDTYLEFKVLKDNGEDLWIGQNVRATFSPTDPTKITGFFGILRNLDEIKKVEIELSKSEMKYRELFDNSKDLIQSVDSYGNILYVNLAWKKTLGYSDKELKKLNLFDIIHPDSRDYYEELLKDILKTVGYDDQREHSFGMVAKSGRQLILKGGLSVQYKEGQVESLQTFLRDVTEHYKVERALKKSEENFRLISNTINDVFFLYNNLTKSYEYISPNCAAVLGAEPEFFYNGENYSSQFIHPDDLNGVQEMDASVRAGFERHIEYRRLIDDEERWIEEEWFPIKDERGEIVSISGICRDVTEMKKAYNTIYVQNLEISQSIQYAKNIQESTLPTSEEVGSILPESFVFYKAKDVLSGDLYIVDRIRTNGGAELPAFIVGDCTGHGVPGGLLSLLCNALLTESLTNYKIDSPAVALDFVREKLIRLFRSNPSKYILDGMDAAFCVLNEKAKELYFAGANLSCYIIRSGEVLEYKGDKQPIGYGSNMNPFTHFSIDIEVGDIIYLTTDGYIDQFGGPKNKKFLRRRFTELLLEIVHLPMAEQCKQIEARFLAWKGDNQQTDDIAIIGVKI